MRRRGNLRLVSARAEVSAKKSFWDIVKERVSGVFVSKTEKIYVIKDVISGFYRDYEITVGDCDLPYFVKAENKIREIIKDGKVDYYYEKLKKYRNCKRRVCIIMR